MAGEKHKNNYGGLRKEATLDTYLEPNNKKGMRNEKYCMDGLEKTKAGNKII